MTAVDIDRDEWLAWRRTGIGASDIAGILGLSPWASPYSVWATKVGLVTDDDATEAMEMGLALEPSIAAMFHRKTGLYVANPQLRVTHPELPWARATLDGNVYDHPNPDPDALPLGILESKVTADSPTAWADDIPMQYLCQTQWQMFVTGAEHAWVAAFHASWGLKFRIYEVERDQSDIDYIVGRVREFYEQHVLTGEPPEVDAHHATSDVLRRLPADPDAEIDLSRLDEHYNRLCALKTLTKNQESVITELENRLKAAMGEATEGFVNGQRVITWRPASRRSIDVGALRAARPEIADEFTTVTESRRFLVTPPKKEKGR